MKIKSLLSKFSSKGFTLIELLIVIAVLGVLASVVLVAINPAEQLKRGRDASRLQGVAQLGHAAQAYFTTQGSLIPSPYTDWQTKLVSSGDITTEQSFSATGTVVCGPVANIQNNICYSPIGTTDFAVYTGVESAQYKTKGKSAPSCIASDVSYFIYIASQGKAGVGCTPTGAIPGATTTLN